ncbi:D-lactate dehydrogenase [cytochrome], mitochondrial, partial [Tanacetum coccineum]
IPWSSFTIDFYPGCKTSDCIVGYTGELFVDVVTDWYDLTRLMIGSEGTLGVITEVTVRLQKIPEHSIVAMCSFPIVKDVVDVAIATMMSGIQLFLLVLLQPHPFCCNSGVWLLLKQYPNTPVEAERVFGCC